MSTTTLVQLIANARLKANVANSNFVTDTEITGYLNEALRQFRELVISADDSYYQSPLDFSISAQPSNTVTLPADFWQVRGLDAFAGDLMRQMEVFAREFRNRFDPGIGYGFAGDGNTLAVYGYGAEQCNPFRLTYTPKPIPLAALVTGNFRSIEHINGSDGTNAGSQFIFINGAFSAGDVGATLVVSASGTALDGTYTILTVVDSTHITTIPAPTPSLTAGGGTIATVTDANDASRMFNIAPTDNQATGYWNLQNGAFGAGADIGSYFAPTLTGAGSALNGTYQIIAVNAATAIQVTPQVAGTFSNLTGTGTISRQPAGTRSSLDVTEDNFAEYFSVRAAMAIARKKRQDTLVGQLASERSDIEARIATMSQKRGAEPKQAPVLWGRRGRPYMTEDWDI